MVLIGLLRDHFLIGICLRADGFFSVIFSR